LKELAMPRKPRVTPEEYEFYRIFGGGPVQFTRPDGKQTSQTKEDRADNKEAADQTK
jgi:hypothetical protein